MKIEASLDLDKIIARIDAKVRSRTMVRTRNGYYVDFCWAYAADEMGIPRTTLMAMKNKKSTPSTMMFIKILLWLESPDITTFLRRK